jgi:hypothetical protein
MSLPHYGAFKGIAWAIGITGAALFAFIEKDAASTVQIVIIACTIAAVPPTVTGIFGLILQYRANRQLHDVGQKVDGILTKAHEGEQAATRRADSAEGFRAGSESERSKP